jgi:hypothetical protein
MAVAGISFAASSHAASQHTASTSRRQQHGGPQAPSMTDIDAQGSSVVSPPSTTGKIGTKIDITA